MERVRDTLGLVYALGYRSVAMIVGHDFGSAVAAWSTLIRPDVFRSMALMTAPFEGAPRSRSIRRTSRRSPGAGGPTVHDDLAALPRPRKHYHWYNAPREANDECGNAKQGIHDFLRAYYHVKSADWKGNKPHPLTASAPPSWPRCRATTSWTSTRDGGERGAGHAHAREIAAIQWLTDEELGSTATSTPRTGFQGGLNCTAANGPRLHGRAAAVFRPHHRRALVVHQRDERLGRLPGAGRLEAMRERPAPMRGFHLLDGAGHWVQQEQPEEVSRLLLEFLRAS